MAGPVPNFIYVGAPKSGSTWLFQALSEHPEVFVVAAKSSGYFEAETPGPVAAYLSEFAEAGRAKAIGELSHDAYVVPGSAARIAAAFPHMKILVCLREPGDFAASVLKWWATHSDRYGTSIAEMEQNPHFLRLTGYLDALRPFYEHFPARQIHVCFFEELRSDPAAFLRAIHEFLGVSQAHRPSVLDTVVNRARPPRYRPLTKFVYAGGGLARRLGLGALVERAKRTALMDAVLYAPGEPPEDPQIAAAAARVRARAKGDLAALEALIGRPLPEQWHEA